MIWPAPMTTLRLHNPYRDSAHSRRLSTPAVPHHRLRACAHTLPRPDRPVVTDFPVAAAPWTKIGRGHERALNVTELARSLRLFLRGGSRGLLRLCGRGFLSGCLEGEARL